MTDTAKQPDVEASKEVAIASQTAVAPQWPRDVHGFSSALRRELLRSITRIKGNDEKHAIFMDTLREAARFASNRVDIQRDLHAAAVDEAKARQAKAQAEAAARDAASNRPADAVVALAQAQAGLGGPKAIRG